MVRSLSGLPTTIRASRYFFIMIRAKIHIKRYKWTVYCYIAVNKYYTYEILERMRLIGATPNILSRAHKNLVSGQLNNGLTYSNPQTRETVCVTCITSSAKEFFNTIVHEIGHVAQHIGRQSNISPYEEDICYLQGELAFRLFPYCKALLCDHCH